MQEGEHNWKKRAIGPTIKQPGAHSITRIAPRVKLHLFLVGRDEKQKLKWQVGDCQDTMGCEELIMKLSMDPFNHLAFY